MRPHRVQVDDHPEVVGTRPADGLPQQVKRLLVLRPVLLPQLLLVNRQADMVKTRRGDEPEVLLRDPLRPRLPAEILGEPVTEIRAAADDKSGGIGGHYGRREGQGRQQGQRREKQE